MVDWRVNFGWKLRCRSVSRTCRFLRVNGFERPVNNPVVRFQWFERPEICPVVRFPQEQVGRPPVEQVGEVALPAASLICPLPSKSTISSDPQRGPPSPETQASPAGEGFWDSAAKEPSINNLCLLPHQIAIAALSSVNVAPYASLPCLALTNLYFHSAQLVCLQLLS